MNVRNLNKSEIKIKTCMYNMNQIYGQLHYFSNYSKQMEPKN